MDEHIEIPWWKAKSKKKLAKQIGKLQRAMQGYKESIGILRAEKSLSADLIDAMTREKKNMESNIDRALKREMELEGQVHDLMEEVEFLRNPEPAKPRSRKPRT